MKILNSDKLILRDLAKRVAEIADLPVMEQRRKMWTEHNSLRSNYPLMLFFPEGSWNELLPPSALKCEGEKARTIEQKLRVRIYTFEHFKDDTVVEKEWIVDKHIENTGWGLEMRWIQSNVAKGAGHYDPVLKDPSDLKKLRYPEISYNEKISLKNLAEMKELFGDILDVKLKGIYWLPFYIAALYANFRGLEEMMLDMYTEPQMLHDAMAFLTEGNIRLVKQYVEQNLLSLNNDNTYHASGGNGFTDELPLANFDPSRIRPCDMWASAQAQELAQVSPEHHYEFVLQYEKTIIEPFGLIGYGCCEDLTKKLDNLFTIPNLRRISISPWADVDICAEKLKGDYIFSWKPNPAYLVGNFNENFIRENIKHTVEVAKQNNCVLEIILKDTHTCENHPERFDRWSEIAREVINES